MHRIQEASRDLGYLIELVVKALFGIAIVYFIAKTLLEIIVGPQAGKVIAAILGIALVFAAVVSKRIQGEIMRFGHG